jgi:hypothetical protein
MLKLWDQELLHRFPLEWHYFRTKFHENPPSCSKVISGGDTGKYRQTGDLISLLPFLESRIKCNFLISTARHVRVYGCSQKWSY